jgi:hypothetical protein
MQLSVRVAVTGDLGAPAIEAGWRAALPKMLEVIRQRAFDNLSGRVVGIRRGRLRGSLRAEVLGSGRLPAGRVGAGWFTGAILERGARPHEIRARRRSLLRFRVAGRWITAASLHHPGVSARFWLAKSAEESQAGLQALALGEFDTTLNRRVATPAPAVPEAASG